MVTTTAGVSPGHFLADRYELREQIGRGASAQVWRARDRELRRDVAVKVFFALEEASDSAERRRAEADLMRRLDHPNLVSVLEVGHDEQVVTYLVLELVEGTTLRGRLRHGPMTQEEVLRLGSRLADALAYVHGRGVVHRDVKPANVMITDDGLAEATPDRPAFDVKLTDFGVARLLDSTRLTADGLTVGTANYLSPEQARGGVPSPASDVYSLGLVLLEALTGELAYPGHGVEAAVARLHRGPELPAWLPAGWRSLLRAMTADDPAARPSAAEVASALDGIADGDPTLTAPVSLVGELFDTSPEPEEKRSRRGLLALAGLAAATVAAVLVLAGGEGPARPAAAPGPVQTTPSVSAPSSPTPTAPVPIPVNVPAQAAVARPGGIELAVGRGGFDRALDRAVARRAAARAAALAAARAEALAKAKALAAAKAKAAASKVHKKGPKPPPRR